MYWYYTYTLQPRHIVNHLYPEEAPEGFNWQDMIKLRH